MLRLELRSHPISILSLPVLTPFQGLFRLAGSTVKIRKLKVGAHQSELITS